MLFQQLLTHLCLQTSKDVKMLRHLNPYFSSLRADLPAGPPPQTDIYLAGCKLPCQQQTWGRIELMRLFCLCSNNYHIVTSASAHSANKMPDMVANFSILSNLVDNQYDFLSGILWKRYLPEKLGEFNPQLLVSI